MIAATRGYRMTLVMPDDLAPERRACMTAYGAQLVLTPANVNCGGLEYARDVALGMQARGEGRVLDQFSSPDNSRIHHESTGPEIWRDTRGRITHFVCGMGTTGTIMGVSRFLKDRKASVRSVGVLPRHASRIAGTHVWANGYMPKIFDRTLVDDVERVTQAEAETMARRLAREEGIFGGASSGAAATIALRLAAEVENATIVFLVCDRGDRYLSTGVFGARAEAVHARTARSAVRTRVPVQEPAAAAVAQIV
jgi:cysteine synthase B